MRYIFLLISTYITNSALCPIVRGSWQKTIEIFVEGCTEDYFISKVAQ